MDVLDSLDPRVLAYAMQILQLTIWLLLLAAIFLPLERLFALHPAKILRKGVVTDVIYYFLSSLLPGIFLSFPLAVVAWEAHKFMPVAVTETVASWPVAVRVVVSLVVGEIGFYWGHRWSHQIPFLWRFHAIHHAPEHIDFLVNTHAHPVDMLFTRLVGLVPLYVLGLASPMGGGSGSLIPIVVMTLGIVWGFFIHANVKWRFGPLEWLIATPAFHHWHHTNDGPAYINKNYASMLPWMDKLFGTLYLPKNEVSKTYGIDDPVSPVILDQLVHPFLFWQKPQRPAAAAEDKVSNEAVQPEAARTEVIEGVSRV